ncbi:hypothetical protein HYC85_017475 [Camellia sinensis]|uniref:Uncharacterized protein n=1 Tax=Camellia sinensis TaxID=4442 RepID=A0A7J7GVF4_CAMSI|nr:hypothetical protein HYC85_017475 [Camellia sinensis]
MGREIVRRESQKEPGKRSRVWCHKDAFDVLRDKTLMDGDDEVDVSVDAGEAFQVKELGIQQEKEMTKKATVLKLKYICNKEGLKASSIALTALANSQMVGRKDTSKSVFDVWTENDEKHWIFLMVWSETVCCLFLQVAVHLLSEKEKNDMAQLVNTMVSYCITYKNLKSDPLTSTSRHDAVSDTSMLSFDPPIGDLINFKVPEGPSDYLNRHISHAFAHCILYGLNHSCPFLLTIETSHTLASILKTMLLGFVFHVFCVCRLEKPFDQDHHEKGVDLQFAEINSRTGWTD